MNRQGNIGTGIALCGDTNVNADDGYRSVEWNSINSEWADISNDSSN